MLRGLAVTGLAVCLALPAFARPALWRSEWPRTDSSQTTVEDWSEIVAVGPPRDGIPAITTPASSRCPTRPGSPAASR